jgi:hypothetical protein
VVGVVPHVVRSGVFGDPPASGLSAVLSDPRGLVGEGQPLRLADLREITQGMSRSAAHREVTRLVRVAIEALRDGTPPPRLSRTAAARTLLGEHG